MQREAWQQLDYWQRFREHDLILASIISTQGSAYRLAGARKIIDRTNKSSIGILSGGCLENELFDDCIASKVFPFEKTYDTGALEERFFGYQKGCRGQILIRFELLSELRGDHPFFNPRPRLNLLLVGASEAARPMGELATCMGWKVHVADYRIERLRDFQAPWIDCKFDLRRQAGDIPLPLAIVSMTHNFEIDLELLREFANRQVEYFGIVGSRERFKQLMSDYQTLFGSSIPETLLQRTFSPAGHRVPGDCPEAVALAITHQVQSIVYSAETAITSADQFRPSVHKITETASSIT